MADKRCLRCFSKIDITAPDWTDDPIKTPRGEIGDEYKGFIYIKPIHIEEIQQLRQEQEDQVGFVTGDETGYVEGESILKTTFTPVKVEEENVYFYTKHIRELRESTEKILEATGQTKEDYFNYDEEGTEYNIGNHQLDWHNADLTKKFIDIKAVIIEDLRHYLSLGWFEDFTGITPIYIGSGSLSISGNDIEIEDWNEDIGAFQKTKSSILFDDEIITSKSTKIVTYADLITSWEGTNTDLGSASASLIVNIKKPLSANCSANANIVTDEEGGYARVGSRSELKMIWEQDRFINPSPYPNQRITSLLVGFVNYNCLTHSRGNSDPTYGSSLGQARLVLEFTFYNATTETYPKLQYIFSNLGNYQSGWNVYKNIALEEQEVELDFYNHLKNAGYDVDNHQIYFVREIMVDIKANASVYAVNLPGMTGGSGYGNINVILRKFGFGYKTAT